MTIGGRLREERERLAMSQPTFAALAATSKQTLFSWESGKTAPDGFQIAAFACAGVDVLYVLTGRRDDGVPALNSSERVLLDSYRACQQQARQNLIQTAALLAAGMSPGRSRSVQQDFAGAKIGQVIKNSDMAYSNMTVNMGKGDDSPKKPPASRGAKSRR